jgi:putative transposase
LALIQKAYRLKLYPTVEQADMLARFAGSCRWLWNYLLDLQQKKYEAEKKFIFRFEMDQLLPTLKVENPWLADAPSNSLQRVCRNLDQALKKCFKEGAGFPRFKKRGISREAFYIANQSLRIENSRVVLPKMKQGVKFRAGRLPEGRILSATVSQRAGTWWCVVQCEVEQDIDVPDVSSLPIKNVIGVDLGLASLMASSDGVGVSNPRKLSKTQKRLRRAQRILARRQKNSANRRRQAARVAVLHAKVADYRSDALHQATTALVRRADVIVTEDLNVQGMLKNKRLSRMQDGEKHYGRSAIRLNGRVSNISKSVGLNHRPRNVHPAEISEAEKTVSVFTNAPIGALRVEMSRIATSMQRLICAIMD